MSTSTSSKKLYDADKPPLGPVVDVDIYESSKKLHGVVIDKLTSGPAVDVDVDKFYKVYDVAKS